MAVFCLLSVVCTLSMASCAVSCVVGAGAAGPGPAGPAGAGGPAGAAGAGGAAWLVALVAAGGDMKRARRSVQQKRQIKTALKDHKASQIAEHKRVADVQDRIDAIADPAEPAETLDLDALADRTNSP